MCVSTALYKFHLSQSSQRSQTRKGYEFLSQVLQVSAASVFTGVTNFINLSSFTRGSSFSF